MGYKRASARNGCLREVCFARLGRQLNNLGEQDLLLTTRLRTSLVTDTSKIENYSKRLEDSYNVAGAGEGVKKEVRE